MVFNGNTESKTEHTIWKSINKWNQVLQTTSRVPSNPGPEVKQKQAGKGEGSKETKEPNVEKSNSKDFRGTHERNLYF